MCSSMISCINKLTVCFPSSCVPFFLFVYILFWIKSDTNYTDPVFIQRLNQTPPDCRVLFLTSQSLICSDMYAPPRLSSLSFSICLSPSHHFPPPPPHSRVSSVRG
ncbi:hypothetical protein CHARACLAT_007729 [Characodon lateralis]|uniref:Uncharacterized protein n=1 Tax=Characodon lateralis TaxID=208331 RepID=A0ABU7CNH1_9TELE|nr:hypothetical protein [Characodon lateralis]